MDKDPLIVHSSRPRDLRLQRILRLIPKIETEESNDIRNQLEKKLIPLLDNIEKWVRVRSEFRKCWIENVGLIEQIDELQHRLNDVPGPGIQLPIGFDEKSLPTNSEELISEINNISIKGLIPISGGIRAL